MNLCLLTNAGNRRVENEDCIRWIEPGDDDVRHRKGMLAIVADGMGGHQAGQVASQLAVDVITQSYYQNRQDNPVKALQQAFNDANQAIYQAAQRDPALAGMGTTATALVLKNSRVYVAHVGDSRAYWLHGDDFIQLTEDHTVVMEMFKKGLISFEEVQRHPDRNVLLRSLGTRPEVTLSVARPAHSTQAGDYFILCSDGLYDLVSDTEIKQYVLASPPHKACQALIDLANARGGYDNISVGIIAIDRSDRQPVTVPPTRPFTVPTIYPF